MDERAGDQLPELGTKAAAVAGIESMIHHAIGGNKICTPVQLRYWLDAYYQARKAAELQDYYTLVDRVHMEDATPHQSPPATASPQGEAQNAEIQVDQFGFERQEGDGAAVSAPPEQADARDGQNPPAAAAAAPFRQGGLEETSSGAAAPPSPCAGKADGEAPKRQRPVGWTDNKLPTEPAAYSGAAAAAQLKREQFERLQSFLRDGGTMKQIVAAAEGNITEDQILGIRECRRVPVAVYRVLQAALDRIKDQ